MSALFSEPKNPYDAKLQGLEGNTPSINILPAGYLSPSGRSVLLNDDIVYAILTIVSNKINIKSDLDRREKLFALCRVCRVWSTVAQSLLFRHMFIQIRSSMMALLKVIDHKTERGQRLAGYIQGATIKLSKFPESKDPPSLPMIHPRHIPALLCHMPNLRTLDLITGWEAFSPEIITAISRGPQITALTLDSVDSPASQMLLIEPTPWPLLESVTIQNTGSRVNPCDLDRNAPPKLRLTHVAMNYKSDGSFDKFHWLTHHSKDTLTHVSLICTDTSSSVYVGHPNLKNIRSLTLGRTLWSEEQLNTLHTLNNLKELRFISSMQLQRPFPSDLPDTIEHLMVTALFPPVPILQGHNPVTPDMARPALLKSFSAIVVVPPVYAHGGRLCTTGGMWAQEYARICENYGVITKIHKMDGRSEYKSGGARPDINHFLYTTRQVVDKLPFCFEGDRPEVPLRIRQSKGTFQPMPSQLDLTDFEVILKHPRVVEETQSKESTARASLLATTDNGSLPAFASLSGAEDLAESRNTLPTLSQNGRYVLLSDDIVYEILTAVADIIRSDRDRMETLFALCRVCRVWSRAAQSLLFRHVFVQIRSSMLLLLKVIDHRTERGRRLAGSIQVATIKLSKFPESKDPPSLPMIHPRHIPALLCHMPNLCTLNITMGREGFNPEIITAIARGPQITALTLEDHYNSAASQILIGDTNPWPLLESITIKNIDRSRISCVLGRNAPPKLRLTRVTIDNPSDKSFEEFHWLTSHSKDTITHLSLVFGAYDRPFKYLDHPNIKNIRCLTLGYTLWTKDLLNALRTFSNLKELRFVSSIQLHRPFPSNLPNTIEHLFVTVPFLPVPVHQGRNPVTPDMARPALLKSFTAVVLWHPSHPYENHLYMTGEMWAREYVRYCECHGIKTEIRKTDRWDRPSSIVEANGSEVPMRTRRPNGTFQPTPSQLDLADFDVIQGGRKATGQSQSTVQASLLRGVGLDPVTPFASIRGLVTSLTGTRAIEDP